MAGPLVLFFGEDSNDTNSLIHLARALLPDNFAFDAQSVRRPPVLRRDAAPAKRKTMAQEIGGFASVLSKRRSSVAVVAHRDCDATEPAHIENALALEADLRAAGVTTPIAATPAWELETWWLLFPEAISGVRNCWRNVNYANRDVGMIENAKEVLTRDLRPSPNRNRCPDYAESDSVNIAKRIADDRLADTAALRAGSLSSFRARLREALLPPPPGKGSSLTAA